MYKADSEDSWILFVVGVALAAFVCWKFSASFGLDRRAGGAVFSRLAVLAVATRLCWTLADEFRLLQPRNTWPLFLSLLWLCLWPALDFWAGDCRQASLQHEEACLWWAAWYTQWGLLVGIAAVGYLAKRMFRQGKRG